MNLSVVIPNHNRADALALTLESLARQTCPADQFEVIIVDQASTDGSRELVKSFPAPYSLRLVAQDAKYGISVGRNGGVQAAQGELIILLDADIIADPELAAAHVDLHRQSLAPILGCGRLLSYPPARLTFIEQVADPEAGLDRGAERQDFPFWYAFGGHLSFTKETFHLTGPFRPELKGAEDIDFAYRALGLGVGIKNCPAAIGYHNHSRSLAERRQRAAAYWSMIPAFLDLHPELRGQVPGYRELEPVEWGHEALALSLAKLAAGFWSLAPVRAGLYAYLAWAESRRALPRLAKFGYYRLMLGEMRAGARQAARSVAVEAFSANG